MVTLPEEEKHETPHSIDTQQIGRTMTTRSGLDHRPKIKKLKMVPRRSSDVGQWWWWWWCYPTPSEGWECGGTPQRPNSWVTPQGLDKR